MRWLTALDGSSTQRSLEGVVAFDASRFGEVRVWKP
jgi:hypothetical protein